MDDPYLDVINENWNHIAMMYDFFRDKKPILEYVVDTNKIYSYPAYKYINALSTRTREGTQKMYKQANKENQFMLFIKDETNQKLRSYIFDVPARE